jgi:Arc/MetJ family transcription regulator
MSYKYSEGWTVAMLTTIEIDDELLAEAKAYAGLSDMSQVVHEGLRALVAREAARRLILLGGTEPNAKPIPRRRPH